MAVRFTVHSFFLFALTCLFFSQSFGLPSVAIAAQNRSGWMWRKSSHPYGAANVLGDAAKEAEVITSMGAWGFDRIYTSVSNQSIVEPEVIAGWNSKLDDVDIDVQFLISDFDAAVEPRRSVLLDKIQTRLINFNNARVDSREHFDAVHLDIEPHTTDAWDDGTPVDKRDLLLEMKTTYQAVRDLLDSGGQTGVEIFADIPVWYDSSASIGWTDDAERDQWFADIAGPLDGLTMMAYERSSLSSIINGVTYEANNFVGEVRVGLNNKEIGPGDTFEDFADYMTMVEALEGDIGITIGGVDHHTFYLLAEYEPLPTLNADFDNDADVDGADFLTWQRGLGNLTTAERSDGDADGNQAVNVFDFLAWQNQYDTVPSPEISAVPEPSTCLGLNLLAAMTLLWGSRAVRG